MRLLLDTHAIIWLVGDNPRLGPQARDLLAAAATECFASAVSILEIAIKSGAGKLIADPGEVIEALEESGFQFVDVTPAHAKAVFGLPRFPDHRDPFDRLLVAQACVEDMTLMTADLRLRRYPATVLPCA